MELERPNIAGFVFFLFVKTFLEFPVRLKPMFLGHYSPFLICLHNAAFTAEVVHPAIEHGVFSELTFQRTVENRYFY